MENIRTSKEYKKMTRYLACAFAEGFCEGEGATEKQQLAAWQYLIDTGACWHLQGFYGRTATALIEEGLCERAIETKKDYYGNVVPGTKLA